MYKDTICSAIKNKQLLRITYKEYSHTRIIEPHLLGKKKGTDKDTLSAWRVRGHTTTDSRPPWRNYTLKKIRDLTVLDETFTGTRPGYNPNDETMSYIYCHL